MLKLYKIICQWIIITFLLLLLSITSSLSASVIDNQTIETIQSLLRKEMLRMSIPGAALAIVHKDSVVFSQGFGIADPTERPVTADTPFILGSTTKSFTALALLQLVENRKVDLDAPVRQYLPWFQITGKDSSSPILIHHLLNHTSGISQKQGVEALGIFDKGEQALENYVKGLKNEILDRPVGERFEYSNTNYAILGLIIQKVSKMPYEKYIQENILNPLGMKNTYTSPEKARKYGIATGYRFFFSYPIASPDLPYASCLIPAGYLVSSANDLAKYLILHLNNGKYKNQDILSSAGIQQLHHASAKMTNRESYGMGWVVRKTGGEKIIWHNGGVPNFYSFLAILPESKYGIILLINSLNMFKTTEMDNLGLRIIRLLKNENIPLYSSDSRNWIVFAPLILILVTQLIWIVSNLIKTFWKKVSKRKTIISICISILLNCVWFLLLLLAVPASIGSPLSVMMLFAPDFTLLLLTSAGCALIWVIVRNTLAFIWMKKKIQGNNGGT